MDHMLVAIVMAYAGLSVIMTIYLFALCAWRKRIHTDIQLIIIAAFAWPFALYAWHIVRKYEKDSNKN